MLAKQVYHAAAPYIISRQRYIIEKHNNLWYATAKEGVNMHHEDWIIPFLSINLCGGTLVPIVNDDEDMLEIRWADGMWIDVGFIKEEKTYYITTVSDDTLEGWNNPLSVLKTQSRTELTDILQNEIFRCRL